MPRHSELLKNNKFRVFIGLHKLSFAKISGLGSGMEKEVYAEGGGISNPHVMRVPKSQLRAITLERGVQVGSNTISKLKPGTFVPWVQIIVLDDNKKPYYEYFLEEVWITKWENSGLDALDERVLVDTFEMEYVKIKKEVLR